MRTPLMHQMAKALAHQGIATFRYSYPYSRQLEVGYREDLIDPLPVLLATTRAAANAAPDLPLFLGGRSMSSQVMSLALARQPWPHVRGLVLYVFPMRWRALLQNTVTHLPQVPVPMLFIQGNRDHEFCDLTQLQPVLNQLRPPPSSRRPQPGPSSTQPPNRTQVTPGTQPRQTHPTPAPPSTSSPAPTTPSNSHPNPTKPSTTP